MLMIDYYIYHHLGLGDHIICNGLVRYFCKKNKSKNISLVVKERNFNNVSRMYKGFENICFTKVDDDKGFLSLYSKCSATPVLRVGFEKTRPNDFDVSFYDCAQISFSERWNSWDLERDDEQEKKIIEEFDVTGDYIFVHDSSSVDKYNLNIDSDLPQIRPKRLSSEKSIFDWLGVIENAKEIHCVNSSFIHLINSYNFNNKKYYHTINQNGLGFSLKGDWEIVNY